MFGAGVAGLSVLSETFGREVDRRFMRPIRNYHTAIRQPGTFNTPDDLKFMLKELAEGFKPRVDKDDE